MEAQIYNPSTLSLRQNWEFVSFEASLGNIAILVSRKRIYVYWDRVPIYSSRSNSFSLLSVGITNAGNYALWKHFMCVSAQDNLQRAVLTSAIWLQGFINSRVISTYLMSTLLAPKYSYKVVLTVPSLDMPPNKNKNICIQILAK